MELTSCFPGPFAGEFRPLFVLFVPCIADDFPSLFLFFRDSCYAFVEGCHHDLFETTEGQKVSDMGYGMID